MSDSIIPFPRPAPAPVDPNDPGAVAEHMLKSLRRIVRLQDVALRAVEHQLAEQYAQFGYVRKALMLSGLPGFGGASAIEALAFIRGTLQGIADIPPPPSGRIDPAVLDAIAPAEDHENG